MPQSAQRVELEAEEPRPQPQFFDEMRAAGGAVRPAYDAAKSHAHVVAVYNPTKKSVKLLLSGISSPPAEDTA